MPIDRTDREARPSPDALLTQAAQESRGRLKIFLGAAPGVGKTYEMLLQGRQRQAEAVDIVIGVVETHGRVETELLTKGFEIVPRRQVPYKGSQLSEMDLDAILKRRPALVLVDELAHTNAPGSRHPKRYLDVEELLAAGIDVYTTLNVQHLESLNDVVARITRIQVRETVPDSILDRADDVELVDLTPDDLIQRLKEGKGLCARAGRARDPALFHAGQSHRAARARAPPHGAARRCADGRLYARPRDPGTVGGERARARVRERTAGRRRARALCAPARGPPARDLGGLSVETSRTASLTEASAIASPRRSDLPSSWAARW